MPDERTLPVAGLVLAAGTSTRMGRNKLLLDLGGEVVVHRAVRQAIAAGLDPVIVVVGHEAERIVPVLADLACHTVRNDQPERGVNRSLWVGMEALPESTPAVVVILADMPLITSEMYAALVERYRSTALPLVVSEFDGVTAPPTLYDRTLFGQLGAPDGDGCGKRVIQSNRERAAVLQWPSELLTDLDEPADYERVRSRVAQP